MRMPWVSMLRDFCGSPDVRVVGWTACDSTRGDAVAREGRVRSEKEAEEAAKLAMTSMKERARVLVQELAEQLNMRCPRCRIVFADCDGCNALKCSCGVAVRAVLFVSWIAATMFNDSMAISLTRRALNLRERMESRGNAMTYRKEMRKSHLK